jgi:hypothetical protein
VLCEPSIVRGPALDVILVWGGAITILPTPDETIERVSSGQAGGTRNRGPSAEAGAIELVLEIAADEDAAHPRTKDEAAGCLLTAETRVAAGGQVTDSGAARPGRHRSRSLVSSVHPVRSPWAPMADACVGRSR